MTERNKSCAFGGEISSVAASFLVASQRNQSMQRREVPLVLIPLSALTLLTLTVPLAWITQQVTYVSMSYFSAFSARVVQGSAGTLEG
eukprot:14727529-Ditylum_brightwellii.AAC.1